MTINLNTCEDIASEETMLDFETKVKTDLAPALQVSLEDLNATIDDFDDLGVSANFRLGILDVEWKLKRRSDGRKLIFRYQLFIGQICHRPFKEPRDTICDELWQKELQKDREVEIKIDVGEPY